MKMPVKTSFAGRFWLGYAVVLMLLVMSAHSALAAPGIPIAAEQHRRELTRTAREVWGLNAPVATFAAQIHTESRWRPNAVSPVGAEGLTQFMPTTADWIAKAYPALVAREPFNPAWAMRALVTYDRHLWERIKAADPCERMAFTLSAYNGGLGWVYRDQQKAAASGADRTRWFDQVERFNAGRHAAAFRENRLYPVQILRTFEPVYIRAGWGMGVCT